MVSESDKTHKLYPPTFHVGQRVRLRGDVYPFTSPEGKVVYLRFMKSRQGFLMTWKYPDNYRYRVLVGGGIRTLRSCDLEPIEQETSRAGII